MVDTQPPSTFSSASGTTPVKNDDAESLLDLIEPPGNSRRINAKLCSRERKRLTLTNGLDNTQIIPGKLIQKIIHGDLSIAVRRQPVGRPEIVLSANSLFQS